MEEQRKLRIGQEVVYHDSRNRAHNALVTAIHGGTPMEEECDAVWVRADGPPCVNLLWVSSDPRRQDDYGRQTERESSVVHATYGVHGNYWRFEDEAPNVPQNTVS